MKTFLYVIHALLCGMNYGQLVLQTANANTNIDDFYLVECNSTMPCAGELVTDCREVDQNCVIDCTKEDEVCKDAEFQCHPDYDCTLLCDSQHANRACLGAMLNASQSSHINVKVVCMNSRACEYLFIETNSTDINLNVTIFDPSNAPFEQYIAKHAEIYLPQSGDAHISCIGHSVCHSIKIYGNHSMDSTSLHFIARGQHAFKDSYLSLPSDSDIDITCDSDTVDTEDFIGECCSGSIFDGRFGAIDSDIAINCIGNNACFDTIIFANQYSKSLAIIGQNGDEVLSKSEIYCPSRSENANLDSERNCHMEVYGNGVAMLHDTKIHTLNGFDDVYIECDYLESIQVNCYPNDQSGPTLYCDDSCRLIFDEDKSEWHCLNENTVICSEPEFDISDLIFPEISTTTISDEVDNEYSVNTDVDIVSTTLDSVSTENGIGIKGTDIGLRTNTKGQIVLGTIVLILLSLCIAVSMTNKETIKEWLGNNSFDINSKTGHSPMKMAQFTPNSIAVAKSKTTTKYASLDESYSRNEESEFIVSDETDDENEFTDD